MLYHKTTIKIEDKNYYNDDQKIIVHVVSGNYYKK
jgi:hypothetical protein